MDQNLRESREVTDVGPAEGRPPPRHPAVDTLQAFFQEMHDWEFEMLTWPVNSAQDVSRRERWCRERITEIFEKYCEVGRSASRVNDWHWGGEEPDYNPAKEQILSIDADHARAVIETQMTHNFGFRLRYELVNVGGEWKIRDNRKCKRAANSWSPWPL